MHWKASAVTVETRKVKRNHCQDGERENRRAERANWRSSSLCPMIFLPVYTFLVLRLKARDSEKLGLKVWVTTTWLLVIFRQALFGKIQTKYHYKLVIQYQMICPENIYKSNTIQIEQVIFRNVYLYAWDNN